jgi:hypothetical protein
MGTRIFMDKEIEIVFHNRGLRSYIEVDLCAECPRQDDKGCCGHYSPIFYPTDLVYLLNNQPELVDYIFGLDRLTILDASVTVNNTIEGTSYRCRFHSKDSGCRLAQHLRESVCRHFVCLGIGWESEPELKPWRDFFSRLTDWEIELNNRWAAELKAKGLTLRDPDLRQQLWQELHRLYQRDLTVLPDFIAAMPEDDSYRIVRPLQFKQEWIL